jgi:hypothetical protein
MPATTDPFAALQAQINTLSVRVAKLETAPVAPSPAPENEAAKFLDRWKAVAPAEFAAKYNVAYGQPIPAMAAYDEAEAIYRARAFYTTAGLRGGKFSNPQPAWDAIKVIANATQETATTFYECGRDQALACYPDTLAYAFLMGIVKNQQEFAAGLGAGTQPRDLAGVSLELLLQPNFGGGKPSGG